MTKIFMPVAAVLAAAVLAGCGSVDIDTDALASALVNGVAYAETLTEVSDDIIKKKFDLDSSVIEDCAAYAGTRAVVDEVAVFKTTDTKEVESKVRDHLDSQIKSYTGYRPEELTKLDEAIIYTYNDTVIYCVSGDREAAMQIILDYTTK